MTTAAATLAALVSARRLGAADLLLTEATLAGAAPFDRVAFEATFAAVGRRFGTERLGNAATVSGTAGQPWSIADWGLDEAGRALLLLACIARAPAGEQVACVEDAYRGGALRERQAVLRALALLPDPARFLAVALDACRTSTQPVFEAIACENPYPAAHFPEPSFNQMVLKAVFTEVPLTRILGLAGRRTTELARMARDYASERAAAGRTIPSDLTMLMTP